MQICRRDLLASTAVLLLSASFSKAGIISGQLPWEPYAGAPPVPVLPGGWVFFTADEGRTVEALADRIIPPDPNAPGGKYQNRPFADLGDDQKDEVLKAIESGNAKLGTVDGQLFFQHLIEDIKTGFFADPIYGGNRDMAGWKMIGFPGTRYNYLDWIDRHNERFPLPPVSMTGRAEWNPKKT